MKKTGCQFIILGSVVWLCLAGCTKKPPSKTRDQVILEKVEERFERWKADMEKRCFDQSMETAIAIVDSTIIANARRNRDAAGHPNIPFRPERPEFVIPDDSTPVKPLLPPVLPDSIQ